MSANLDAWITGNYGEDHPDNQDPDPIRCQECRSHFEPEDMSEMHPEALCSACYDNGFRICTSCEDPAHVDDMRAEDLSETWCDHCLQSLLCDESQLTSWADNLSEMQYVEQSVFARLQPLPERIACACIAHEWRFLPRSKREALTYRERIAYLRAEANKLVMRFASGTESGFERNIWRAVTKGDFRK